MFSHMSIRSAEKHMPAKVYSNPRKKNIYMNKKHFLFEALLNLATTVDILGRETDLGSEFFHRLIPNISKKDRYQSYHQDG